MPSRSVLGVSLTPELTAYAAAQVASGRYRGASEVVRDGLLQRDEPLGAATSAPPPNPGRDRRTGGDGMARDGGDGRP